MHTDSAITLRFHVGDHYRGAGDGERCNARAVMTSRAIISRGESLQILMNDLRKAALERRSAELDEASAERREAIITEIDRRFAEKSDAAGGSFPCGLKYREHESEAQPPCRSGCRFCAGVCICTPLARHRSARPLIWLTKCQQAKVLLLRFFLRSSVHRKPTRGEAAAAGEIIYPAVGRLIFASYPELAQSGPVRIFLIHRGRILTLSAGVVLRGGVP